ncbi:MAG: hypothetical protein KKD44_29085 [Proteobacteria bacterium]|nr:hypothetical protein [Pseudomonadota bacterium]
MTDGRIPIDLIGATARGLADGREDIVILVREKLEIETRPGGADPIVKADGRIYEIKDLPAEIEQEILVKAQEHREVIEGLRASKYLDPSINPLIKTGE